MSFSIWEMSWLSALLHLDKSNKVTRELADEIARECTIETAKCTSDLEYCSRTKSRVYNITICPQNETGLSQH